MDLVARVEENYAHAMNRLSHRSRSTRSGDRLSSAAQDRLDPAERLSQMRLKRRDSSDVRKRMAARKVAGGTDGPT
jgi:hypothetical protein